MKLSASEGVVMCRNIVVPKVIAIVSHMREEIYLC